jgi:WD40 repeat protein
VWATDAASDAVLGSFNHRDWVWALAVRSDKLLTTAGADLYRWDIETGRLLSLRPRVHASQAHAVQGTRSGHFTFTAGEDGMVRLFDERLARRKGGDNGAEEAVVAWRPHGSSINALAFEDPWLVRTRSRQRVCLSGRILRNFVPSDTACTRVYPVQF